MGVKHFNFIEWQWVDYSEIIGAVAIDVPNYLARRLSVRRLRSGMKLAVPVGHVSVVMSLILHMLRCKMLPVFIFDGPPEVMKRDPLPDLVRRASSLYEVFTADRNPHDEELIRVLAGSPALQSYFMAEHIRQIGRLSGVPVVTAPSEAEMFAAVLCRERLVQSVVSNDVDTLLFGSPHVTKGLKLSSGLINRTTLGAAEEASGLDLERLRDLAIVCGCDFFPAGLKGIGLRKGILMLKRYGSLESVLKRGGMGIADIEQALRARETFSEVHYISTRDVDFRLHPPLTPRLVHLLTLSFGEERATEYSDRILRAWKEFGKTQTTLDQWT
jgi:flap endonuclease-1